MHAFFLGIPFVTYIYIYLLDFTALESFLVPQLWLGFELAGTACRVSLFLSRRYPCMSVGLCAVGGTMKRLIQALFYTVFAKYVVLLFLSTDNPPSTFFLVFASFAR